METVINNPVEAIKKRYSERTFSHQKPDTEKLEILSDFMSRNTTGPFGNKVRFKMIYISDIEPNEKKQFGTYGFIKNASFFMAGVVKSGNKAMEDFGYLMEKNILKATELELGTVWLGGSLNRSAFGKQLSAAEDEVIPAVVPVGLPSEKKSFMDKMIRNISKGNKRKDLESLILDQASRSEINYRNFLDKYLPVLEMVRIAPSASNKQPWRFLTDHLNKSIHLYMKEEYLYNHAIKNVLLQNIDMGIAICHFELTANAYGINGRFVADKAPSPELELIVTEKDLIYIASWQER